MVIYPIYASLETLEQRAIFESPPTRYRKIVFATNIAATSVTIDGIRYVVDAGFVKQKMYDPSIGISSVGWWFRISRHGRIVGSSDQ
jgi:HrpA-like RNA helicase